MNNKAKAQQDAIRLARERLHTVDLPTRCPALGLPEPDAAGVLRVRAFGRDFLLAPPEYCPALPPGAPKPARLDEQILILHYLLCERVVTPTDTLVTFREFPGGQFYWEPFLSRTAAPLLKRIGNDLELLRRQLGRFDWEPLPQGDLGARVHAVGRVALTLVYHPGDEEFPPAVDVLFDACARQVFNAEDAAAIASRICLGLL